jgi:hypothetical protein
MSLNYTPLRHTPLNIQSLYDYHEKNGKKFRFDGVFFSLSLVTIVTLATIIYTIVEKRFITGF